MKTLLFHAIQPGRERSQTDWENFLREASFLKLPEQAERLAPNVWLLPDDDEHTYLTLSQLGEKHATETRICPFVGASDWQPLSPRR